MFSIERWSEVFEAISKNKLRTFLTGLSVSIGILILVLLLGVGEGMSNGTEKMFSGDATNKVTFWSGVTGMEYKGLNAGRPIDFKNEDFDLINQLYSDDLEYSSSVVVNWSAPVVYKNESKNYRMEGALPDYQFIQNIEITQGRFINHKDQENSTKYVVIGRIVKEEIFKDEDPLGKTLTCDGVNYKVVGVFSNEGDDREESKVIFPLSTTQQIFLRGNTNVRMISFTTPKEKNYDIALEKSNALVDRIEALLKERKMVAPMDTSAIGVSSSLANAKKFYDIGIYINGFFWFVGLASLMAGIIGVSNIMLIIVKERTKEIGIRKALGAKPWNIIGMILHESIFVTAIAGFMGLVLGLLLLEAVGEYAQSDYIVNPEVSLDVAISTVIVLVVSGAIAGFFPARRGAKIKPIVALRDE